MFNIKIKYYILIINGRLMVINYIIKAILKNNRTIINLVNAISIYSLDVVSIKAQTRHDNNLINSSQF